MTEAYRVLIICKARDINGAAWKAAIRKHLANLKEVK